MLLVNKMVNQIPGDAPLDVLGDGTRRAIVIELAERPRPATALAARFRITKPAISRHLRLLRERGVVEEFRVAEDGRVRMYRLRPESLDDMQRWMEKVRAFWAHQLAGFAEHARQESARIDRKVPTRRHPQRRQAR